MLGDIAGGLFVGVRGSDLIEATLLPKVKLRHLDATSGMASVRILHVVKNKLVHEMPCSCKPNYMASRLKSCSCASASMNAAWSCQFCRLLTENGLDMLRGFCRYSKSIAASLAETKRGRIASKAENVLLMTSQR
jgi:hypothetical protein